MKKQKLPKKNKSAPDIPKIGMRSFLVCTEMPNFFQKLRRNSVLGADRLAPAASDAQLHHSPTPEGGRGVFILFLQPFLFGRDLFFPTLQKFRRNGVLGADRLASSAADALQAVDALCHLDGHGAGLLAGFASGAFPFVQLQLIQTELVEERVERP